MEAAGARTRPEVHRSARQGVLSTGLRWLPRAPQRPKRRKRRLSSPQVMGGQAVEVKREEWLVEVGGVVEEPKQPEALRHKLHDVESLKYQRYLLLVAEEVALLWNLVEPVEVVELLKQ